MYIDTVFIFLVMALVNSIYRVKCKKKESNTYSKMENKSSEAAAMTVLLGRDFIGNARNLSLIVRVLIAYLLTFLFFPVNFV